MQSNYYLRGPVINLDTVYIATTFQTKDTQGVTYNDLYFLVKSGNAYFFTSQLGVLPQSFVVNSIDNDDQNLSLVEAGQGSFFLGSTTVEVSNVSYTVAAPVSGVVNWSLNIQGNINPWGVFLAGVTYTISNLSWVLLPPTGRNISANCIPVGANNSNPVITSSFYVVPQFWYVSNSGCGQLVSALESYTNEFIWFYDQQCGRNTVNRLLAPLARNISNEAGVIFRKEGYTRLSDCNVGVFYNYCTGTTNCSGSITTGCMGPCSENDLGCRVDQETKEFTCQAPQPPHPLGLPLWAWALIFVGAIILLLLILGGITLLIIISAKKKQ